MSDRANKLIESVAEGTSPRDVVKTQLNEGMDLYSLGYRCEDLQSATSRVVSDARSLLMKCKAYKSSIKNGKAPDIEKDLATAHKALEQAEAAALSACTKIEDFKEKSKGGY